MFWRDMAHRQRKQQLGTIFLFKCFAFLDICNFQSVLNFGFVSFGLQLINQKCPERTALIESMINGLLGRMVDSCHLVRMYCIRGLGNLGSMGKEMVSDYSWNYFSYRRHDHYLQPLIVHCWTKAFFISFDDKYSLACLTSKLPLFYICFLSCYICI